MINWEDLILFQMISSYIIYWDVIILYDIMRVYDALIYIVYYDEHKNIWIGQWWINHSN